MRQFGCRYTHAVIAGKRVSVTRRGIITSTHGQWSQRVASPNCKWRSMAVCQLGTRRRARSGVQIQWGDHEQQDKDEYDFGLHLCVSIEN